MLVNRVYIKKTFTSLGVSQGKDLLPPGPIYTEVRATVFFTPMPSSQTLRFIKWQVNSSEVIRYDYPGSEYVNATYQGRVTLNSKTGELALKHLTMADSGNYTLTLTYESGLGFQDYIFLHVFGK